MQPIAVILLLCLTSSWTLGKCQTAQEAGHSQGKPELTEGDAIRRIKELTEAQIQSAYNGGQRPALRDAHSKQHGCVRANFTVLASLLPTL